MIKKNRKGFTLVEVIASLAMIAIVATSLVGIFIVSNKTISRSNTLMKNNNEIQNYINEMTAENPELIVEYHENNSLNLDFGGEKIIIKGCIVLIRNKGGEVIHYKIFQKERTI